MIPDDLRYVDTHEWIRVEGDRAWIGITHYAQSELGDIVFVQLPEKGKEFTKGEVFGSVESVKTSADLFSPLSGTVEEINPALSDAPELINQDPYGQGWMLTLRLSKPDEIDTLLSAQEYLSLLPEEYRKTIGK